MQRQDCHGGAARSYCTNTQRHHFFSSAWSDCTSRRSNRLDDGDRLKDWNYDCITEFVALLCIIGSILYKLSKCCSARSSLSELELSYQCRWAISTSFNYFLARSASLGLLQCWYIRRIWIYSFIYWEYEWRLPKACIWPSLYHSSLIY